MNDFVQDFIHHGCLFIDDEFSSYEGLILELRCDVDMWSYFKVVEIIKDMGLKDVGIILYKDPIFGMLTLSDVKYAKYIVYLCKVHLSVMMVL